MLTVDAQNVLRVYITYADQSELLFKKRIQFASEEDYAIAVEFYFRAKCIVICSKLGENIVITSQLKQFNVFGPADRRIEISNVHLFEHKNQEKIALGLTNG